MTVHLRDHNLTHVAVPGMACTSIWHAIFQIENARMLEDYLANGKYFHVHSVDPTRTFQNLARERIAGHARFGLIRDPVRRLLSCYSNRVIFSRYLSEPFAGPALLAAGLRTNRKRPV